MPTPIDIIIRLMKTGSGVSDAVSELQGLQTQATSLSGKLSAMGDSLISAGTKMTLATVPIAALGAAALAAAADDATAMAKTERVFGSAAAAVEKFASTSVKALGMSDDATLTAISNFGAFFTAMGVGQTSAANMSTALVKLSADVGAYNDISTAEAADKLKTGLTGVYKSLKDINIIMTATEVNNRAVADGMADSTTTVSEAAATIARYELLMEKTTLQQGYLATHSDTLAASTNRAKAQKDNAAASLGQALVPMAIQAAQKVTDLATAFTNLGPATQNTIVTMGAVALAAGPVTVVFGALLKVAGGLVSVLPAVGAFMAGVGGAAVAAAVGLVAMGLAVVELSRQIDKTTAKTLTDEQVSALIGMPTQAQLQARLNNDLTSIAVLKAQLKANPSDTEASINLTLAENDVSKVTTALAALAATGTSALHDVSGAAAASGAAFYSLGEEARTAGNKVMATLQAAKGQSLIAAFGNTPDYIERKGIIASGQLDTGPVSQYQKAIDAAAAANTKAIGLAQTAADKALTAIQQKFESLASTITTALDDARKKAAGLFDLGGGTGPGGINIEPGKNGPFEAMYRITDIAASQTIDPKTGKPRKPGKDTKTWEAMYGPELKAAGTTATAAATAFQAGNLFAPGVKENINWQMFGEQAAAGLKGQKITTYAGEAATGLLAAGKPLTAEAMQAAVDSLAAKDKAGIIPSLTDINAAVKAAGGTAHTDFTDTIAAINAVAGAINGKQAPTTTPPPGGTKVPPIKGRSMQGMASGGIAMGGWTLTSEGGPELVNLPGGSRVYNNQQTRQILQSSGSGNEVGDFLKGLRDVLGPGLTSMKEAGAVLANMLTSSASNVLMQSMVREYERAR